MVSIRVGTMCLTAWRLIIGPVLLLTRIAPATHPFEKLVRGLDNPEKREDMQISKRAPKVWSPKLILGVLPQCAHNRLDSRSCDRLCVL